MRFISNPFWKGKKLHKKNIVFVLIPGLLMQLCGCYSMQEISNDEMAEFKEGGDLIVSTKDSTIYFFEESNYYLSNASLYGIGYAKYSDVPDFKIVNKSVVALTSIKTLKQEDLNLATTGLLIGGILAVVIAVLFIIFPSSNTESIAITYTGI